MAQGGSTIDVDEVYARQVRVGEAVEQERRGAEARRRADAEKDLLEALQAIGAGGNLVAMLESERVLLKDEYARFANTADMKGSLETALVELDGAAAMVPLVRDPAEYVRVDATHRFRTHRIGKVPRDDARMFFRAHGTRLQNLSKARGTDAEKAILFARQRNIRVAENAYRHLQHQALGLDGPEGGAL